MWCKNCNIETNEKVCPVCGTGTVEDVPVEIYWCKECATPIIHLSSAADKGICPICGQKTRYLSSDLRPVFPEERLLLAILLDKEPTCYMNCSVWAANSRYYIDGKALPISLKTFAGADTDRIAEQVASLAGSIDYSSFNENITCFARANEHRLSYLKDEAFSFYYPASLKVLRRLGAEIVTFSPLHDAQVPEVDGLLIGGGFPEMFAARLAANASMRQDIYRLAQSGLPILAECGGYMYMMESLTDFEGRSHAMVGALPGRTEMTAKLQMVGYVEAELAVDSLLGSKGEKLRGHEFHFSKEQVPVAAEQAAFTFRKLRNNAAYPAGKWLKNVLGSYLHLHFAGCPKAAERFVSKCTAYRQKRGQADGKI